VKKFAEKHQNKITGVLYCFDRLLFKGYLPIGYPDAMEGFLYARGLLLKDFVTSCSQAVKAYGVEMAQRAARPYIYLKRAIRKEERARQIA